MTPEEIAQQFVDADPLISILFRLYRVSVADKSRLAERIASAIRAELERAEAREEVASEWKYLADRRANLIDEIAAERDRLHKECRQWQEEVETTYVHAKQLEDELEKYQKGYKGACYACEPVGMLNQKLNKDLHEALAQLDDCRKLRPG